MTEEQLIEFLHEKLSIEFRDATEPYDEGTRLEVILYLDGKAISSDHTRVFI